MLTAKALQLRASVACLILFLSTLACYPGGPRKGYRPNYTRVIPLRRGERVPDISEATIAASGPSQGAIAVDSPRYNELVENFNSEIVFANGHRNINVRRMSKRCQDRLMMLSIYVGNTWPGVHLRVFRSFQVKPFCKPGSLHCEGRAIDFTTDDSDPRKYGYLARLAVHAGFDWVHYDSDHIHASVRADGSDTIVKGGCFPGNGKVQLRNGTVVDMRSLSVGDSVLAVDRSTGRLLYTIVLSFMDKQPTRNFEFVEIKTKEVTLTLTESHMLFAANRFFNDSNQGADVVWSTAKPIHASEAEIGQYIFILSPKNLKKGLEIILSPIINIQYKTMRGAFAPLTTQGTMLVDGAVASCYGVVNSEPLAHAAFFPARTLKFLTKSTNENGILWYADALLLTMRCVLPKSIFSLM